jgi:hypothetical protein
MQKNEFEVMKKIFSNGEFDGLNIRVVNAPRFHVESKAGDMDVFLDGEKGLSNRNDYSPDFILTRLRERLTTSDVGESFPYVGVDTVTNQSEKRTLHLALQEYGVNSYAGTLLVPDLMNHILKDEYGNESPESIAGIESQKSNRVLFNLVGSAASNERPGFDRVMHGEYATVYLNSKTGEWLAEKTEACKAQYAPLAHLSPADVTNDDLIKAMGFAPVEVIYRA